MWTSKFKTTKVDIFTAQRGSTLEFWQEAAEFHWKCNGLICTWDRTGVFHCRTAKASKIVLSLQPMPGCCWCTFSKFSASVGTSEQSGTGTDRKHQINSDRLSINSDTNDTGNQQMICVHWEMALGYRHCRRSAGISPASAHMPPLRRTWTKRLHWGLKQIGHDRYDRNW